MSLLSPFREAARRRIARSHPVDERAWISLVGRKSVFRALGEAERVTLASLAAVFLREKTFMEALPERDGTYSLGNGDGISPDLILEISAHACLPVLNLGLDALSGFSTVIVVPREYYVERNESASGGVMTEYLEDAVGESFDFGPLVLSAEDVAESGRGKGFDVVIHEIAHKLDERNGEVDGVPRLPRGIPPAQWQTVFLAAYEDFRKKERRERYRKPRRKADANASRIDPYAAESPEEFFAVACEYYFDMPTVLLREYPGVHALLGKFFSG